ncbi:MAG: carboxymuconolactone decarboxylase family protein [Dehalococcoidia bacterium]
MARVRLNETQDVAEDHRWIFERMEQRGPILNIFRALSHSPEALLRFMRFGSYFLEQGKLDPKLRELAILRVGMACRAPYEFSQHIAFGRRAGLSDAQIRGVGDAHGALFDAHEMAVLAFAGELTADARVSQATFDAVAQFLNEEEIVELTMVTGFYNMVSRTLNALEVDIDAPAAQDLQAIGIDV